ncbi:MAG TPA: hypothetical protein VL966_02505 [Alphaproteobacteria bacterium]|nr:hypothetical protein [Alphaproteobacteria bacterium]
MRASKILLTVLAGVSVVAFGGAASAQEAEPKGRLMTVIVYTPPGSVYDLLSRMIARHMPQHLPGAPSMIVRNMPGAGGLTATRYLYSTAPKDGSVFGTVGRGIPFEPLLGGAGTVDFDPRKFTWLGSPSRESSLAIAWHTATVKTADDLLSKELIIAGTGASADSEIIPRALNGIVGTKFKIISGYDGITKASLAMETGEIEGIAYWSWSGLKAAKMDLIRDGKIRLLFQSAPVPHPEIPDVPSAMRLAKTEAQRQALALLFARDVIAFPFFAPPDLPSEAAKQLTAAFATALRDQALLAEAKQAGVTIDPVSGEEALEVLNRVYDTPTDVVESVRTAMGR